MSNSFNISVKPEIAALEAKVDIIDTEVGLTKTDTAAILIDTAEMQPKLPTNYIMGSDVPASKDYRLDAIYDRTLNIPDDPASNTEVNANETKIDANKAVVDAIKLKTDALPQNVRGKIYKAQLASSSDTFLEVANVSGHGKIVKIAFSLANDAITAEFRLTIDGNVYEIVSHTGDLLDYNLFQGGFGLFNQFYLSKVLTSDSEPNLFNVEFESSFILEARRSAGAVLIVRTAVFYTLDSF